MRIWGEIEGKKGDDVGGVVGVVRLIDLLDGRSKFIRGRGK